MKNRSLQYRTGFSDAVDALGREGDYLGVDWSAPYKFLTFELKKIGMTCKTCKGKGQIRAKSPSRYKQVSDGH